MSVHPDNWYCTAPLEDIKQKYAALNEETGMPELPDGMVWRVRVRDGGDWYGDYIHVEAIRPRKHWSAKVIWSRSTYQNDLTPTSRYFQSDHPFATMPAAEIVLRMAVSIIAENRANIASQKKRQKKEKDWQSVTGLYPPLSLDA